MLKTDAGTKDSYEEGKTAYYSGLEINANPYDDSDPSFDEWEDGWCEGEIEDND